MPDDVIVPLWAKIIAGGTAGVIGTSLIFPIDMVKTRLQNSVAAVSPLEMFRRIVRAEGARGLYQGIKPNLIGVFPEKSLKLSVNDTAREYFTSKRADRKIRLHEEIFSGGLAGFLQVSVTNPMEIVKLRMQLQGEVPGGARLSAGATVAELGVRGLYRGVAACWLRDVPFSFIFFPLFANVKTALNGEHSIAGLFAAGAIAGSLAAGAVTPCDVIKTRLQVKGGEARYAGIADCARKILAEEGVAAFGKGLVPRMLVQAPLFGCTLLSYEVLKAIYRGRQAAPVAEHAAA